MQKLLALSIVVVLAITVLAGIGIVNLSQNGNTLAAAEPKARNQIIAKPSQEADKNNQIPIPDQIPVQQAKPEPKADIPDAVKPQPPPQEPAKAAARDLLGETVTLGEARRRSNFTVLVPPILPENRTLQQVRLGSWSSPDRVSLFYSGGMMIIEEKANPNVDPALLAENAIRENRLSSSLYKPKLQRFIYAGADGFGYDPWLYGEGDDRVASPGAISFIWHGAHYAIIANLSYNELVRIAISMLQ